MEYCVKMCKRQHPSFQHSKPPLFRQLHLNSDPLFLNPQFFSRSSSLQPPFTAYRFLKFHLLVPGGVALDINCNRQTSDM